tara:strand:- start:1 stop:567 length:567 start_codon:yes stop_codon:yes gene_type:complete
MDFNKSQIIRKNIKVKNGFGLVDSILSLSLLAGVITYGVYFSSLRLSTVHSSNLIRSINKEIERDIERLKLDLWTLSYDNNEGKYLLSNNQCEDVSESFSDLPSWQINNSSENEMIQSWRPGEERSKVFSGGKVLITRELKVSNPIDDNSLNNSIGTVNYIVEWGEEIQHWLSIDLSPEAHSWCEQKI